MATKRGLSASSPYEQTFQTRHRGRGRPEGDNEPVFVADGVDPLIVDVAKRRAYAVIHERYKAEMAKVFAAELMVLKRRGVSVVADDTGRSLDRVRANRTVA